MIESNVGDTGDAYNWLLDLLVPADGDHYAAPERRGAAAPTTFSFVGPRVFDLTKIVPISRAAFSSGSR